MRVACNWIYAWLVAGMSGEQREEFDAELNAPPGGRAAEEARVWARMEEAVARMQAAEDGAGDG